MSTTMKTKTSAKEKVNMKTKNSKPIAAMWKSPTAARIAMPDFSGFGSRDVRYRSVPGSSMILSEYVSHMKVHINLSKRKLRIMLLASSVWETRSTWLPIKLQWFCIVSYAIILCEYLWKITIKTLSDPNEIVDQGLHSLWIFIDHTGVVSNNADSHCRIENVDSLEQRNVLCLEKVVGLVEREQDLQE